MGTASVSAVRPTWPCKELVTERACQQQRAPVDYHKHANAGQLEERKLREIAHSRVGRSILQGYERDRKSTRLNSSHGSISYAVFCLKKKENEESRASI